MRLEAHTPLCRMSHKSPKVRGGGDSPQALSTNISIYIYRFIYSHVEYIYISIHIRIALAQGVLSFFKDPWSLVLVLL